MNNLELLESCKKAITEGRCLGCTALENINFKGNPNCEYSKENLGIQEKLEL